MKNFKKLAALGLTAALSLSLLAACGGGTTGTAETPDVNSQAPASENPAPESETPAAGGYGEFTTLEEGKLIMVTNASFPPYEMTDDDNNIIGIDPDIAQAICDKLGYELKIEDMAFEAILTSVDTGKADFGAAGMTVNPEREESVDFTDTYAEASQVVIVRK